MRVEGRGSRVEGLGTFQRLQGDTCHGKCKKLANGRENWMQALEDRDRDRGKHGGGSGEGGRKGGRERILTLTPSLSRAFGRDPTLPVP